MACKRKLEVEDFESISEPANNASIHGVVSELSPIKKSRYSEYFEGNVYDGQSTMRLVGFKKSQQNKMKQMMENKQPIHIDDCQIKSAQRGNRLDILLKSSSKIMKSPKKIDTTNMRSENEEICLDELDARNEYDKITTKVKVIQILQTVTVHSGKTVQEVLVGDSSGVTRCSLWEQDMDSLSVGSSYLLKNFEVHEFASKKYITKARHGCEIIPIEDIGDVADKPSEVQDEEIKNAQIVGVPQLTKYKSCLRCKARVEPSDPPFGRCSKEDCQMYQRYDICKIQLSVKLLFFVNNEQLTLSAFGQTLLDIANTTNMDDITEEAFLQIRHFPSIKFNDQKIITNFTHST